MILDYLSMISPWITKVTNHLRNRSLVNSTRFKNHLPSETPPMETKKRRVHIARDHASELFNLPPLPLQKTTHPRRATRLDYACFTVHYNITLILHDKPLIFYKRPRPIWGEAERNLPERVAIRGEKKCPTTLRRYDISFCPTFNPSSISVPQFSIPFFHPYISFIVLLATFFSHIFVAHLSLLHFSLFLFPILVPSITRQRYIDSH